MPKLFSTDATIHAAQNLIYAQQNPAPEIPLVKLGNPHKEALRSLVEIFTTSTPPAVPLRVTTRGGVPRKTPKGEPRYNPNEKFIPIKYIHQCITSEGDHNGGIHRGTPTSAPSKKIFFYQAKT